MCVGRALYQSILGIMIKFYVKKGIVVYELESFLEKRNEENYRSSVMDNF